MDEDTGVTVRDPVICVTGLAHDGAGCDPTPFLKVKKSRKFMGLQDDLAVACAGRALAAAGLSGKPLGERAGLYLAVGYIPFQEADFGPVLDASTEDGRFSMRRFAEEGYQRAHPLLTFKCLPNMPAYHVSFNFDLQGPYLVTYPGAGQLYTALEEAVFALREGRIDVALVGGVAHQRNFLVEHHFRRIEPPVPAERLVDAGAMMVLETEEKARARGAVIQGRMTALSVEYRWMDIGFPVQTVLAPGATPAPPADSPSTALEYALVEERPALVPEGGFEATRVTHLAGHEAPREYGPASLPLVLGMVWESPRSRKRLVHRLLARDGIEAMSTWTRADAGELPGGEAT
jgi:3-oxoacyl-(acyl-carrier-protein) synthase